MRGKTRDDTGAKEKIGTRRADKVLGRIFKLLIALAVLGALGLTGYAYLADLSPIQEEITVPVTLNAE